MKKAIDNKKLCKILFVIASVLVFAVVIVCFGFKTENPEEYLSVLNSYRIRQVYFIIGIPYLILAILTSILKIHDMREFGRFLGIQGLALFIERSVLLGIVFAMPNPDSIMSLIASFLISFIFTYSQFLMISKTFVYKGPEAVFLYISIPILIMFLFLISPVSTPDNNSHIISSYRFSNIILGINDNDGYVMQVEDYAYLQSISDGYDFHGETYPSCDAIQKNLDTVFATRELALRGITVEASGYTHMAYYSILCWMPQIIGLTIGRLIGLNPFWLFTLARMIVALTYILVVVYAIRVSPLGKSIICGVALFPMCLFMAVSFNYDSMVLITVLGFLANVFRLKYSENGLKISNLIQTILFAILLGGVKGGGFILLIITAIFWSLEKKKLFYSAMIVFSGIASFILFTKILPAGIVFFQMNALAEGTMPAVYSLQHPVRYFSRVANYYFSNFQDLTGSMFGTWGPIKENTIPFSVVICMPLLIVIKSALSEECKDISKVDLVYFRILVVFGILYTPASVLVHNLKQYYRLYGVQGRYYLPFLILFLILLAKKLNDKKMIRNINPDSIDRAYALTEGVSLVFMIILYFTR